MKLRKFISELKRRNVFKATIAYLAISWVIIQIASILLPAFNAPESFLKVLIILLLFGFVFWVGFSWIYDLTPEGFQKTDNSIDNEEMLKSTDKRLNRVIVGSLSIAVVLLVVISFWAGSTWNVGPSSPEVKKVVIFPLTQDIGGENEDYFKTGMTDALINELSKVDQLTVISRNSTQVYAAGIPNNNSVILKMIEGIDYYINGEIKRRLNLLSIKIELKENYDSDPIWNKSYTKDISEVRPLWAEIAADLAREMGLIVKQEDAVLWSNLRPVKPETYELYLKGKHYMNKSTAADWQRGLVYMQEALDKNPADPFAYAFLAEAYINLGHGPNPPPDVFPKALAASQRAIQLDSTVALGWAALSHYHTYFGKDWALAEYAFERANDLNPNLADNHYHRAWYLALFGRMNEAIKEHKRAQELDPFGPLNTAWLGDLYRMVGLYEEGLAEVEKATNLDMDYALSLFIKGSIFMDQGKVKEGLESLRLASEINPDWKYVRYGSYLIREGYIEEGKKILEELESLPINGFNALCIAFINFELGDYDKAFESLTYEPKHGWYPWLRIMLLNNEIQKDPRFLKLIRDMNLPDPAPLVYNPEL